MLRTQSDLKPPHLSSERRTSTVSFTFAPMTMSKESSGAEYTEQLCAAVPSPLEDKTAEFEKAELFMAKFFKIVTTILTD